MKRRIVKRANGVAVGGCWEEFKAADPEMYKALADIGMSVIRLFVFWPEINPAFQQWEWARLDGEVKAIRDAGLRLYLDPYFAPVHASAGVPTYMPYSAGCTAVNPDGSVRFATEKAYCTAPPRIDGVAMAGLGAQLAMRYGADVSFYGIWNEPGINLYYPPNVLGGDWGANFCEDVVRPFVSGVRSSFPDAKFIGPEADTPDVFEGLLRHEKESGERWWDVLSFHPYAWDRELGFPADAYKRTAEFIDRAKEYRNGRLFWITEIGASDNPDGATSFIQNVGGYDVDAVMFHQQNLWLDLQTNRRTALGDRLRQILRTR